MLKIYTAQKMKFSIRISSLNVIKSQETAYFVTFTEEILNGKPFFLCSASPLICAFKAYNDEP